VDEQSVRAWNEALTKELGGEPRVFYRTERHVQLPDFGLDRFVCLLSSQGLASTATTCGPLSNPRFVHTGGMFTWSMVAVLAAWRPHSTVFPQQIG
jgi:hypothetical protein